MIYITGDIHIPTADVQKLSTKRFPLQKTMTRNDFVIICGDFGGLWDGSREEKYWTKWLDLKNFTTLFVDGNHENFDMLNECEVIPFCGGKARRISDNVYHLMRGQIFNIDGKRIFTFGGASSHDKEFRAEGKTWWREELPSEGEYASAQKALSEVKNRVDIIITHCAPSSIQKMLKPTLPPDTLTEYFDFLRQTVSYEKWFFGHYHIDCNFDGKHISVFDKILFVDEETI